jgi:D-glycero-D-manno-heptose 1,7-bisphosphate phosphatase
LILDRDGVINRAPIPPKRYILRLDELKINEEIIQFIVQAQKSGWIVCVATNQQAVGKGLLSENHINLIHKQINLRITEKGGSEIEFFICSHLKKLRCGCRKPMPGLLLQAIRKFSQTSDAKRVVFIGDQETDRRAADSAGVQFLKYSKNLPISELLNKLE